MSNQQGTTTYKEILSVSIDGYDIALLITGNDSLTTGYNEIFFRVKKDSAVKSTGYVKFFPKMWMTSTYAHSTPASPRFVYDNSSGFYRGYTIFNMPTSPPLIVWNGFITFVDSLEVYHRADSVPVYVSLRLEKQWRLFYDSTDQTTTIVVAQVVTLQELGGRLRQSRAARPDLKVFIGGDREARYEQVIQVMDLVRQVGISRVALETKWRETPEKI